MKYELRAREDGGVDVADKDGCVFASLIGLCASGGIRARDRFFTEGDLMIWERETGEPVTEMVMEMHFREPCVHMTIPAVLYDGNPVGSDHEYKGFFHEGKIGMRQPGAVRISRLRSRCWLKAVFSAMTKPAGWRKKSL